MSFVRNLSLHNVRCYDGVRMDGIDSGLIVLTGPNGAGKTNVLEAVSLLTAGRGLRSAGNDEIQKRDAPVAWVISADIETGGAEVQVGTGLDSATGKRTVRINGVPAKNQTALSDYLACVWLTPQMDRLFLDSSSGRRRFFDKLVFTFPAR
jgi:DNA replication and repair protein RecF